ncbi:hypothetical protein HY734_01985 [Candidatus Uhrbacteria bacterium]|nr:hypothetical protein [Candidatus Uhrbacteria bacterium]
MKKTIVYLSLFGLLMAPALQVSAAPTAPTDEQKAEAQVKADETKTKAIETAEELGITFDDFKDKLVDGLDKTIEAIDKAQQAINSNIYISDVTKQELTDALADVEAKLRDYRDQVDDVTTMEELEVLNAEVKATLQANKDVIKEAIQESVLVIAGEVEKTVEKIKVQVDAVLGILKITCEDEADTIENIESQLAAIDALTDDLEEAIKAEDVDTAKSLMKQAAEIVPELVKDVQSLVNQCSDEIESYQNVNG